MMKRRDLILAAVAGLPLSARAKAAWTGERPRNGGIPLVHITDLYHPPQDPDDHIDLATVAALDEYDLKGVILDATRKFMLPSPAGFDIQRDPGFVPVVQLSYLLGRSIPVAAGPTLPLSGPEDDVSDRIPEEQAGVRLLLNILEETREEVVVSLVGSARVLTAAYNRSPHLVRTRVRSVLLNAGSTGGPKREWNVDLDPEAYVGLWRSGLPIHWYPCATEGGAFNTDHERGTYWKTTQAEIFRDLTPSLRGWFAYAFAPGHSGDIISALVGTVPPGSWDRIIATQRNMWSTVSLVMGAGRVLGRTEEGWRFVAPSSVERDRIWPWRLDKIGGVVNAKAGVEWRLLEEGGNALLFQRGRGPQFGSAMAEALCALLGSLIPH